MIDRKTRQSHDKIIEAKPIQGFVAGEGKTIDSIIDGISVSFAIQCTHTFIPV